MSVWFPMRMRRFLRLGDSKTTLAHDITPRYNLIPLSVTMSLRGTLSRCQHSTSGISPRHWPLSQFHVKCIFSCGWLVQYAEPDPRVLFVAYRLTGKWHVWQNKGFVVYQGTSPAQTNVSCVPQWPRCSFTADKTLLLPNISIGL
jgi:hypothetical protein